jgi:nucleotide-binding universal stress UspA family protein
VSLIYSKSYLGKEARIVYKTILLPLDSSELSELSLEHIKNVVTTANKSEIILFMVLERISFFAHTSYPTLGKDTMLSIEKQSQNQAQDYVSKVAGKLNQQGLNARGVVVWGLPADEILKYIKENKIDLVIMTTHGRSGIRRWAFGSVAEKVIRYSTAPVLIVPPLGFRDGLQG